MIMPFSAVVLSTICLIWLVLHMKLNFLIYLTNWTLIIHFITSICLLLKLRRFEIIRVLLIISWTLGWLVTLMFWLYVYPLLTEKVLKTLPMWFLLLSHGGVHLILVFEFLTQNVRMTYHDFKYPLLVMAAYMFLLVLPLKYNGIIIYPLFFDEIIPTIMILFAGVASSFLSFHTAVYFSSKPEIKTD